MKNKIYSILLMVGLVIILSNCQSNPYAQGEALYINNCQTCHQENGEALKKLIPPLAKSDYLVKEKDRLACIIRYGLEETIMVNDIEYDGYMGPAEHLSDVEITNIINYINNSFGNKNGYTSLENVQQSLESCEQ